MFKEERRNQIREILEKQGRVRVEELADRFGVSKMTIRRDLEALARDIKIERTYGGAIAPYQPQKLLEPSFPERINVNYEEKRLIAEAAESLILPGEKIFLSAGTTAYLLAQKLTRRQDLFVVVNSILIASLFVPYRNIQVLVLGGFLRHSELSLHGYLVHEALRSIHLDKAIIGIRGIHPERGLTNDTPHEIMTDRAVLGISDNIIVIADHTKFGHIATSVTAPVEVAKTIVTSSLAPREIVEAIRAKGVEVIQVEYKKALP
jgi:DeoR/GlpR family transcriptional regulator of sugar metabolism